MMDNKRIAVVYDREDSYVAHDPSIQWAVDHLSEQLESKGLLANEFEADLHVLISPANSRFTREILQAHSLAMPSSPEAFCMAATSGGGRSILLLTAADVRGFLYAILEIADRVKYVRDPFAELAAMPPAEEKPAARTRSVNRLFVSEVEDKPWFYDREFWFEYLTELATNRFNRLQLALGMGYDYGHDPGVKDNYFCFAYPFLLSVPGYEVKAKGLPEGEAGKNLDMLRFISREAKLRGIHFQLGLWTHAYDPSESPNANYWIEGIHPGNHAAYCRDAVELLVRSCPDIGGITLRSHYESGIPEPADDFWREIFTGIARAGRKVEIDLHAKGLDFPLLEAAVATNLPVTVSPKYWAEHMGLPYHQAAIRQTEMPAASAERPELMKVTATTRRFTRYGYGDFLREDRRYDVMFRLWPGTQRVLLWGDPEMAAGYGRFGTLSGSAGIELCEPLSFKGRKGSGKAGGRDPYKDAELRLKGEEWKKYLYSYRLWGRLLYDPDAGRESRERYLRHEFGGAAEACGQALAHASRILPLVTTAHSPSAANNVYWPEMYANMPIVDQSQPGIYDFDSRPPHTFSAVSPLDPALFYAVDEFVQDLLNERRSGKVSPLEVCDRLLRLANEAETHLAEAATLAEDRESPSFRRLAVDVSMQIGLGRFFANKLRAAFHHALFERLDDLRQLGEAVTHYRAAKKAWEQTAAIAEKVYREDITFGYVPYMRGHWNDRIQAIAEDLTEMERLYENKRSSGGEGAATVAVSDLLQVDDPPAYRHSAPEGYKQGEALMLRLTVEADSALQVRIHYRHLNQLEPYQTEELAREGGQWQYAAVIPASYTDSPYPLLYFFEIKRGGQAWFFPRLEATLSNQPYYVIRPSASFN